MNRVQAPTEAALLRALDSLLRDKELGDIAIADITARAGVTRSAFYFYFDNKAACVAALGAEMYAEAQAAGSHLLERDLPPEQRIRAMVDGLLGTLDTHRYLYRATLEAARTSRWMRDLWDSYRESFVEPIATMIEQDRAAGLAPPGPDPRLLAGLLLDLSDRLMERVRPEDEESTAAQADALATVWLRAIHGEVRR